MVKLKEVSDASKKQLVRVKKQPNTKSGKVAEGTSKKMKKQVTKVVKETSKKMKQVTEVVKGTSKEVKKRVSKVAKGTTKTKRAKQRKPWIERRERILKRYGGGRGVVLISHLPHGFYEHELHDFFGQFGLIKALRVPRNKMGRSKGYAFIEFKYKEIAQVAAEAMNNYIVFGKVIKTEYIPPEKQKPHLFHRKSMPWDDATHKETFEKRRSLISNRKSNSKLSTEKFAKKVQARLRRMQNKLFKITGTTVECQVNDHNNDNVQLLSVQPSSSSPPPPPQSPSVKTKKLTGKQQRLISEAGTSNTDESESLIDTEKKLKKNTSNSKLKTVKRSLDAAKGVWLTEVTNYKAIKALKTKINNVAKEHGNVIKKKKLDKNPLKDIRKVAMKKITKRNAKKL